MADRRERINVRDLGARGDGVADDYQAIQDAVARINAQGGGLLEFPKGTYRVARHRIDGGPQANGVTNFTFTGCQGLRIEGNGSKIDLDGDWVRAADFSERATASWHNAVGFTFVGCRDLVIRDLEIDGNADLTTKVAATEGPSHGMTLAGCTNVVLERLDIHHMQADGLYVSLAWDPPDQKVRFKVTRNLWVSGSRFHHNARQGMSVIQARHATFHDCEFSFTGQTGRYGGHAPAAGVDVEPNRWPGDPRGSAADDFTGDLVFSNCRFVQNAGFEYVGTSERATPHPVTFYGCTFSDVPGSRRPAVAPGSAETRFLGCTFQDVQVAPFMGRRAAPTTLVEIGHSTFRSTDPKLQVIRHGREQGRLLVHDSLFEFVGSSAPGPAKRIFLDGDGLAEFTGNVVTIDSREHRGGQDPKFFLQGLKRLEGNTWLSDLPETAGAFVIMTARTKEGGEAQPAGRNFTMDSGSHRGERAPW